MASGSGWNLWVWLAGGGCGWNLCGCGCKEVHITYLVSALFCSSIPYFCSFKKCFSFLFRFFFVIYVIFFSHSINTYGRLRASHGSHMKGCTCFICEEVHRNERFISCDGHQLYAFKGLGVDLEVETVRYIEIDRGPAGHIRAKFVPQTLLKYLMYLYLPTSNSLCAIACAGIGIGYRVWGRGMRLQTC